MSKGRIIISTTKEGTTAHGNACSHHLLLTRQFSKFPDNKVSHAIGMFEGKEELSVIIDIPDVPFIELAASAHVLCLEYQQQSVYFSQNGEAFLATASGDMVRLGRERENYNGGGINFVCSPDYTRIIGTHHYIWTDNK